jgi:hypothetical protein
MLAYIFVLMAVALLPETNGRDLSFEDDQPIAGKEDSTVGGAAGTQTI